MLDLSIKLTHKLIDMKKNWFRRIMNRKTTTKQCDIHVVSKCDCDKHIACIVCGEEKGLDGDFWKRMKEQ